MYIYVHGLNKACLHCQLFMTKKITFGLAVHTIPCEVIPEDIESEINTLIIADTPLGTKVHFFTCHFLCVKLLRSFIERIE